MRIGFGPAAELDRDLVEWYDGEYEGRLTVDILRERPERQLSRDGCPGGESPEQVATRADRIVERVRRVAGDVLLFSSAHFLRVLAARWIGGGTNFWQIIHAKHGEPERAGIRKQLGATRIRLWNDARHVLTLKEQESRPLQASANL